MENFNNIGPYDTKEVKEAIERLKTKETLVDGFLYLVYSNYFSRHFKMSSLKYKLKREWDSIETYYDFQKRITSNIFLPSIISQTSKGITISGIENLEKDKSYLFISTHRDIVLDCAFVLHTLIKNDLNICEMAIGDNLIEQQFSRDLFKLNGGVTVKRGLSMRENYREAINLSNYFVDSIINRKVSMWVAQQSGRSKDGKDITNSAIIKMLYISQKNTNVEFKELIKNCNIVPVAISYQYDPNDINKSRQFLRRSNYKKKKYEDAINVLRGLRKQKGKIHIAMGKPLKEDYNNAEEVAKAIDKQIHSIYKLFDTNWFAYDYLNKNNNNIGKYKNLDQDSFLKRYKNLDDKLKKQALGIYANPVKLYLESKNET